MNELAKTETGLTLQPKEITMSIVQTAQAMGQLAYDSGIFKAPKAAAASMIMLKGYELGFPMTAAAEFIQVIEGTVGLTPRGALAIMRSRPDVIRSVAVKDLYDIEGQYYGCECTIVRIENGKDVVYTERFTLDDAKKAELIKDKSGWVKYPRKMCQWRALGFCSDIACPDLLAGMTGIMKMPEIMDDGEIHSFADNEPIADEPKIEIIEAKQITMAELLEKYGAEKILLANNGAMPKTNEECAKIAEALEGMK